MIDLEPVLLSMKLSAYTTGVLLIICIVPAWYLATRKSSLNVIAESVLTLPLVLPPTVIGFYILLLLSPRNTPGMIFESLFDYRLVFSFPGIVIASVIHSLPYMIKPLKTGFESIPRSLIEVSYTLGKSEAETFIKVIIPLMKKPLITGLVMTFAHTMGEFGVILMVGGNIAGKTKTASVAIFEYVETMEYATAHMYSLILIGISLSIFIVLNIINSGDKKEVIE